MIDALEHYGGSFIHDPGLIKEAFKAHPSRTSTEAKAVTKDEAIAMAFLLWASKDKYGDLLIDVENQF